ncbi:hypothetical protein PACTADRAFT_59693 [Pachysolen tannophilus NRRL Y-2460]|uniref:ADF-H domain-containing protein n=1 Tax=Pachysolen tannophilus NRRL Y-2460 TaxID=669874 RepID=A0A1E4TT89_PACTA|nr:hypothetical protein PACTADRAFT_59693 [Pachysolen tannophilus NRRL Y-2460]
MSSVLYSFSEDTLTKLKKFRFQSSRATTLEAITYEIDKKTYEVKSDNQVAKSIDELVDELPDNSPSFIVLSYPYKLKDGRIKSPLVLIYYRPATSTQESKMLYAGAVELFREKAGVSKVIQIEDEDEFQDIEEKIVE